MPYCICKPSLVLVLVLALALLNANTSCALVSQNASVGQLTEFSCTTRSSNDDISWSTVPDGILISPSTIPLAGGQKRSVLQLFATPENNNTVVRCVITDVLTGNATIRVATLMVQGILSAVTNLTSTQYDACTLNITWNAPYTLQGVPINYYTINITRHSDGALLRSDTTNTTEYLYTVSSLGETLEVLVTAVNDAGTGNTSFIMAQTLSRGNKIQIENSTIKRINDNQWNVALNIIRDIQCQIDNIYIKVCNNSACVNATGMSADGRRVRATFTSLKENKKFTATVEVQYNGGVVQTSHPVEISTFDVSSVTVDGPVMNGRVCLRVKYVDGHKDRCFVRFKNIDDTKDLMINETFGCIDKLLARHYTIIATDSDAATEIEIFAPINFTLNVSSYTTTNTLPSWSTPTNTPSVIGPTPSTPIITQYPALVTELTVGIFCFFVVLIAVIIITVMLGLYASIRKKRKKVIISGAENSGNVHVTM